MNKKELAAQVAQRTGLTNALAVKTMMRYGIKHNQGKPRKE